MKPKERNMPEKIPHDETVEKRETERTQAAPVPHPTAAKPVELLFDEGDALFGKRSKV
jgi:hypothetical protein